MALKQGSKVKSDTCKDLQTTISEKFCHSNKGDKAAILFSNMAKITVWQAFLAIYILCKSDRAAILIFEESTMAAMLFFKMSTIICLQTYFHSHKHVLHIW